MNDGVGPVAAKDVVAAAPEMAVTAVSVEAVAVTNEVVIEG